MVLSDNSLVALTECLALSCVILWTQLLSSSEASLKIISSPSGSFSYPTNPSTYPAATEHTWLIKAGQGMHINLTLSVIDVEAYRGKCIDIIEIKDGNNSEAPLLGGYCNSNKPSYSILSSSNAMRVWFQSAKNSDGGLGFNVSYVTIPDQACGGQLGSFPGSFSTPRYPLPYPNNRECTWKIRAPAGMYVRVEFHGVYRLEYLCRYMECECVDRLEIKDGGRDLPYTPREGYCFIKPRSFTSRTNEVSLKFVSDFSGRYEGFHALYTTSLTKDCGADIWKDHGLITSPNYPHGYHSYVTCIWRITAPDDHYVTITFHEFDINASHGSCFVDHVAIHDGYNKHSPVLAKLCNGNFWRKINSTSNKVYIVFESGLNIEAKGFKVTYVSFGRDKQNSSDEQRKRRPRHNDMENSRISQKKPYNLASRMTFRCWMIALGFQGILRYGS